MQQRSPVAVFALSLITFGIYSLVWQVKTKNELNKLGGEIPTAWLLIVPFANLYWIWKYSEGVEKATNGKVSMVLALVLLLVLSIIGMAVLQSEFNKVGAQPVDAGPAPMPVANPGSMPSQPVGVTPVGPSSTVTPEATLPSDGPNQPPSPPTGPLVQ
jgi:hypothetical protein